MKQAPARPRRSGFTLVELLVVLAVLGLVSAVAVPMFAGALPSVRIKAAARDLGADLRLARARAIATNDETTLTLDLVNRRYTVPAAHIDRALPADLEIVVRTARSETVGAERASFRFFPDGGSTGGRVTLSNDGRVYVVGIDWLTGRVTIVDGNEID